MPFLLLILSQIVLRRKINWYIIGLFTIFILHKMPGLSCAVMTVATYRSTEDIRSKTLLIWSYGVVFSMLCKFTTSPGCPKFRLCTRKALYMWRNMSFRQFGYYYDFTVSCLVILSPHGAVNVSSGMSAVCHGAYHGYSQTSTDPTQSQTGISNRIITVAWRSLSCKMPVWKMVYFLEQDALCATWFISTAWG